MPEPSRAKSGSHSSTLIKFEEKHPGPPLVLDRSGAFNVSGVPR